MAFRTGHVRMGRHVISRPLRRHDVTGLTTERRLIHLSDAAIACCTDNDKIDCCRQKNKAQGTAENRIAKINCRVFSWKLPRRL